MGILEITVIGVGATLVVAFLVDRSRKSKEDDAKVTLADAQVTNDITQVDVGGVIRLPPFGSERAPVETYVIARHRYDDGGSPWYELVCEHGTRELLIEWERDGRKVEVTAAFDDENPKLEALGLTDDDLHRFDEDERGEFRWEGRRWRYEDSGEVNYYEGDGKQSQTLYAWSFYDDRDERYITIEKWARDARFYVYHSWTIDPDRIEVYDAGGK